MLGQDDLLELYSLYGFETGERAEDAITFLNNNGYFRNAEIVQFSDSPVNAQKAKKEYEEIGYSARIIPFESIDKTHEVLFNGFFKAHYSNKKLLQEYDNFCKQQSQNLSGVKYEYISGTYLMNNIPESRDIISKVSSMLSDNNDDNTPHLIILEAAAGYGKTCTSFEIIANILRIYPQKVPLLAELSKNRKATIFRYVLLSEIDKKFPNLSSQLVTFEIKSGRIPLIIDGFDELLSKANIHDINEDSSTINDAQTMLDTIAQLLHVNSCAKILLTTRKSSFITGEIFDQFVENQLDGCKITRIQLMQPNIHHWLGSERVDAIAKLKIDIKAISSPVLLSMLRNETLDSIANKYSSIDDILNQYLELLLRREQTRQSIPLNNSEQLSIMERLAAIMVEMDISSEEIDFIKIMIEDILTDKIHIYIDRCKEMAVYDGVENVTTEEGLIGALSHHALLDRTSYNENRIGFLNEFIFGVMISNAVIQNYLAIEKLEGKYLDIALIASSNRSIAHKETLSNILKPIMNNISPEQQLLSDIYLVGYLSRNYKEHYWDGICFDSSFVIDGEYSFSNCVFSGCTFDGTTLCTDAFLTCQFYNCQFFDLTLFTGQTKDCELMFIGCTGHEIFASEAYRHETAKLETVDYQRVVLEQFWKLGYKTAEPRRAYRTLFKGIAQNDRKYVSEAIKKLISKGILIQGIYTLELNFEKINDIKIICGR